MEPQSTKKSLHSSKEWHRFWTSEKSLVLLILTYYIVFVWKRCNSYPNIYFKKPQNEQWVQNECMHLKKRSFKCKNDQLVYMYDEFCFSSSETNSRNETDRGFPAMVVSIHCTYLITYLNCSISLTLKNSVTIFSPLIL